MWTNPWVAKVEACAAGSNSNMLIDGRASHRGGIGNRSGFVSYRRGTNVGQRLGSPTRGRGWAHQWELSSDAQATSFLIDSRAGFGSSKRRLSSTWMAT